MEIHLQFPVLQYGAVFNILYRAPQVLTCLKLNTRNDTILQTSV